MATIQGTNGGDTITDVLNSSGGAVATSGPDSIAGLLGNDSLAGAGGADTLAGGKGFDTTMAVPATTWCWWMAIRRWTPTASTAAPASTPSISAAG